MSDYTYTLVPPQMPVGELEVIVELQRTELDRLLKENARLNARVDKLVEIQEREQVLRQEMQQMMLAESQQRQIESRRAIDDRRAAEKRSEQLKQALVTLVNAIDRNRRPKRRG